MEPVTAVNGAWERIAHTLSGHDVESILSISGTVSPLTDSARSSS